MSHRPSQLIDPTVSSLELAGHRFRVRRPAPFVLVIDGLAGAEPSPEPSDYLHEILLAPAHRESFLGLVDATGLVCCLNVKTSEGYRDVRGRSSRGRLSPGEYFHHDGCSGPTKPRVVEIRCPYQDYARNVATAVAPFRDVVPAMLRAVPRELLDGDLPSSTRERVLQGAAVDDAELDHVQGLMTRAIRRSLNAEAARRCLRQVDRLAGAYFAPWQQGESRLIANDNLGVSMQHRRAYQEVHRGGESTGRLVKRWTNEEYLGPGMAPDPSAELADCHDEMCRR